MAVGESVSDDALCPVPEAIDLSVLGSIYLSSSKKEVACLGSDYA